MSSSINCGNDLLDEELEASQEILLNGFRQTGRQTLSLLLIHFICYSLHHHYHPALNELSTVTTLTD